MREGTQKPILHCPRSVHCLEEGKEEILSVQIKGAQVMKRIRRFYVASLLTAAIALAPLVTQARPRPPFPPVPEKSLASWRFDDPTNVAAGALLTVNPCAVESWSGYALQMSGTGPALFAVPQFTAQGQTNFLAAAGTLRFWFAPDWGSASEGSQGPGAEARLLEVGAWAEGAAQSWWTLAVTADGNAIRIGADLGGAMSEVLRAPIGWQPGSWHQVALAWSANGTALYLDGQCVTNGVGVSLAAPTTPAGVTGFCLGSDVNGFSLARGQFDELVSFGRLCSDEEIAWNYSMTTPLAELGPITPEEEAARLQQATLAARGRLTLNSPSFDPGPSGLGLDALGGCTGGVTIFALATNGGVNVMLTITNAEAGRFYDLFRALELLGNPATNTMWRWVTKGTNGQSFTFPTRRCSHGFYVLGCDTDTDGDTLTDAFEILVSKTSPSTNRTYYSTGLDDLEWWLQSNILVNDPDQDWGNEQNSQFETAVRVIGTNVIVAWVDSNRGVYGLGADERLTNYPARRLGYAVSRDGGVTFEDRDAPPMHSSNYGDAGDPMLAVDRASGAVYMAGTSPRNLAGSYGIPLWKSADGGVTFSNLAIALTNIVQSDGPSLSVDDWPGTGQHDVYVTSKGWLDQTSGSWLAISTDGSGSYWTNPPVLIRGPNSSTFYAGSPAVVIGSNHTAYAFWLERTGPYYLADLLAQNVHHRGAGHGDGRSPHHRAVGHHEPKWGQLGFEAKQHCCGQRQVRDFSQPAARLSIWPSLVICM